MYALWHPYAAHHIPLDLREILRNYITIRKEIWHNITSNYSVPQHTDVMLPHIPPDGADRLNLKWTLVNNYSLHATRSAVIPPYFFTLPGYNPTHTCNRQWYTWYIIPSLLIPRCFSDTGIPHNPTVIIGRPLNPVFSYSKVINGGVFIDIWSAFDSI